MEKYILIVFTAFLASCSLDFPPEDQISDPEAITSAEMAQKGIAAAYDSYPEKNYAFETAMLSDDFQSTSLLLKNQSLQKLYNWDERELTFLANSIWENNYQTIAKINVILDRLPSVRVAAADDEKLLKKVKSQAIALKALSYFEILKYFGAYDGLGILQKDNFNKTTLQKRLSFKESIAHIENLLSDCVSSSYENGWINADAIEFLKADVALWNKDYQKCVKIAQPMYEKYIKIIEKEHPKKLWQNTQTPLRVFYFDKTNHRANLYNDIEYDPNIGDFVGVNSKIVFENQDVRKDNYTEISTLQKDENGVFISVLGKYSKQRKEEKTTPFYNVIRAEEIVFIYAEALLKIGEKAKATQVINDFLLLRNSSQRLDSNKPENELLTEILFEKQKEFVGERHRFFDLKRNNFQMRKKGVNIPALDQRWIFKIPNSEKRFNTIIE